MYPLINLFDGYAVSSYSLFTTLGAVVFALLCYREVKRLSFSIDIYWKLFFLVAVFGMIGSKIFYAVSFDHQRFFSHPIETLTHTGWMIYGAFIGSYVALLVGRIFMKFPLFTALDIMTYGGIFGLGIGRIACFLAGCCSGLPTDSFLGVTFPSGQCAVHPTQLYESFFAFSLFTVMHFARKKFTFEGFQMSLTFIGYGIFRFLIEFIRADSLLPGFKPFTPSQYISIVILLIGLAVFFFKSGVKKYFFSRQKDT